MNNKHIFMIMIIIMIIIDILDPLSTPELSLWNETIVIIVSCVYYLNNNIIIHHPLQPSASITQDHPGCWEKKMFKFPEKKIKGFGLNSKTFRKKNSNNFLCKTIYSNCYNLLHT